MNQKKYIYLILIAVFVIPLHLQLQQIDEKEYNTLLTERVINSKMSVLKGLASHPIVVREVKLHNEIEITFEEIKKIDDEWIAGMNKDTPTTFALNLQQTKLSRFIKKKMSSNKSLFAEIFACDKRGVVVGECPITSDYNQGDEDKFIKCYNNGDGKLFINSVEFDESSGEYTIQVSLPILDKEKTIGVIVMGIIYIDK